MRIEFKPREILSRHQRGVDYGADMIVIARSPRYVLWSRPGHMAWGGVGGQHYVESEVQLYKHGDVLPKEIHTGRHNGAALTRHPAVIAAFGETALEHIRFAFRTKATLLVDGGGGELRPSTKQPRQPRPKSIARIRLDAAHERKAYQEALKKIAGGHNDPRTLAKEVLAQFSPAQTTS